MDFSRIAMGPRRVIVLLALLGLVDRSLVQAQVGEGSQCFVQSKRGVCRLLDQCKPVLDDLIAGRPPTSVCGYKGRTPIVCCPSNSPATPVTTSRPVWSTTTQRPGGNPGVTGRPARRMCAEYAKAVYTLELPPVLLNDPQPVNVSLCAFESKKLIIGGTKAEPKEFPHMAALGYQAEGKIQWKCGATLISDRFVLTAAHCVVTNFGPVKKVRVGDLNLVSGTDDAKPQERDVVQWSSHPNYKSPAKYNDIGLLKMDRAVEFNAYVRPACLSLNPRTSPGSKAVATGWGTIDFFDDDGSNDLLKVTLPIHSCSGLYRESPQLPNNINDNIQFCAGQEGKDTCQGDSGGPLVVYSTNEECMYDVVGVTSFGSYCGSIPGVFTRIYAYLSWIEGIVWPNLH